MQCGFQEHLSSDRILNEPVVDFISDQSTFTVLNLQQLSKSSFLSRQLELHLLSSSDVGGGEDEEFRTLLVDEATESAVEPNLLVVPVRTRKLNDLGHSRLPDSPDRFANRLTTLGSDQFQHGLAGVFLRQIARTMVVHRMYHAVFVEHHDIVGGCLGNLMPNDRWVARIE